MTQDWIEKTLVELKIKHRDARVYALLTQHKSKNAKEIGQELNMHRRQVYRTLKKLDQDNFIIVIPLVPAQFSAVPFDRVLNMLKATSLEGTKNLENEKTELLNLWKSNL